LVIILTIGFVFLIAAVWLGRRFGHHLPELEHWIAANGPLGWAVFVGLVVVLTSVYVPDTIFALAAGVLFGVGGGTVLMAIAGVLTAHLNFGVSRLFLRDAVHRWLDRSPKLAAIERAINHEGLRFQLLLRLTPIHPVTVNYMLGATNTRYLTFLAGCVGLIPGLFVAVYFGDTAKHIAKASGQVGESTAIHAVPTIVGLLLAVGLLVYVTRLARRALRQCADVRVAAE
jgi:uncharacterized membrane protein YdjX (TVP38/TMEM64 family)